MIQLVEIGGIGFSKDTSDIIVTHALSSCVAVTAYCKLKKVGGMIHIALPSTDRNTDSYKKGYFANTGLPIFLNTMTDTYKCLRGDLELEIFGGANSIYGNDMFNIGSKNLEYVKTFLKKRALSYKSVATGGYVSRTIEFSVGTGEIKIFELPLKI